MPLEGAELQRVQLTRTLTLWQRKGGHRTGTDDVLCAWAGVSVGPDARRVLDLGAGQGAVGLMVAGALPEARVVSVEAQAVSHALLVRNVAANDLTSRFTLMHGDLREVTLEGPFDLVTSTPPFMPVGSGTPPADPQREAARFELRGGIEAYCATAARVLSETGTLVIVMDGARPGRYEQAIGDAGLHLKASMAVVPGPGRAPTYLIYWAGRQPPRAPRHHPPLVVRDDRGGWTDAFSAVRHTLDLPR